MSNNISLREYQMAAGNTDLITPEQFKENHYYVVGSSGECGELSEKVVSLYEKVTNGIIPTALEIENTMLELSDISWYLVRELFAMEGTTTSTDTADECQELSRVDVKLDVYELIVNTMKLITVVCSISELTKKVIRDHGNQMTTDYVENVKEKCRAGFSQCSIVAANLGYKYSEVLNANITKLASRKQRNMVHGSGDRR